ncbi:hypothetical protein [Fluviicola sp.]|uniref:hypothetical protein n=1 Tax=Fluviicola sp. TaxID=1917219 RepID=UPI003D2CC41D
MFQKKLTRFFVSGLLCLIVNTCFSQTQTVRGTVVDNISQSSIPGAVIKITGLDSVIHAVTDENGGSTCRMFRWEAEPLKSLLSIINRL